MKKNKTIKQYVLEKLKPLDINIHNFEKLFVTGGKCNYLHRLFVDNEITDKFAKMIAKALGVNYIEILKLADETPDTKIKLNNVKTIFSHKRKCCVCKKYGKVFKFKAKHWVHLKCINSFKKKMLINFQNSKKDICEYKKIFGEGR